MYQSNSPNGKWFSLNSELFKPYLVKTKRCFLWRNHVKGWNFKSTYVIWKKQALPEPWNEGQVSMYLPFTGYSWESENPTWKDIRLEFLRGLSCSVLKAIEDWALTPPGSFLKKSQPASFKLPQVKAYSSYKRWLDNGKKKMIKMAMAVVGGKASACSCRPSEKAAFDGGLRSSLIVCTGAWSSCSTDCCKGGSKSGGIKWRETEKQSHLIMPLVEEKLGELSRWEKF